MDENKIKGKICKFAYLIITFERLLFIIFHKN